VGDALERLGEPVRGDQLIEVGGLGTPDHLIERLVLEHDDVGVRELGDGLGGPWRWRGQDRDLATRRVARQGEPGSKHRDQDGDKGPDEEDGARTGSK
jgi:hypothetical protein